VLVELKAVEQRHRTVVEVLDAMRSGMSVSAVLVGITGRCQPTMASAFGK
jgi:hypothetical protein